MKLLGSTKSKINRYKNRENVTHLEITEVVLIHCNIVNNNYRHNSIVLCEFAPNKSFGQLLDIPQNIYIYIYIYWYIEVWFTDQNSKQLVIEDKINITLVIN